MIPSIFSDSITIKRRASYSSATRDALNNPVYGAPTASWTTVYSGMPARLAFSAKEIEFAATGERVTPDGVMYYPPEYTLLAEDRVITATGIEYVVVSIVSGIINNDTVDHYEAILKLP